MDHITILAVAGVFLCFGLVSGKIRGSILTGPMLFAAFGLLAGPAVLDLVPLEISNSALHTLAQITLILVLFADAASIDLRQLRRDHNLPVRMLLIGMPLGMVFSALAAFTLLGGFSIWEALLLAAILAPSDAALGQAVVINRAVPVRIRQALNVESGLNDGIALPFVLIFAAMASDPAGAAAESHWLAFGVKQVTLGPLAGMAVGYFGGKLVALCHRTGWMTETAEGIIALALAFGAFALAELVHGNGFIAAFVGGLAFGNTAGKKCRFLYKFAETEGKLLVLLTFLAFGCAMIPIALDDVTGAYVLFALLALTVLRMVPVAVSLLGTGIKPVTGVFLGWFGPRGLATVLFVLLILEDTDVAHKKEIFAISIITVALSILLHGATAGPAARWYGAHSKTMGTCEENRPVAEEPFAKG